ncbi:hypothetical protein NPIL_547561 [Nephila pilipes]|uniref:Uncharacterized protein n=1 Tax=Nephila pilipes TaxID=299642 RepID=A0A8X6Q4E4_NEPPI|nr:hypothetical protein NPIL_547561 [Nephila pilipes]
MEIIDFLAKLILNVHLQILFVIFVLLRWAWRIPRPRKGTSNKTVFISGCDSGMGHCMARKFDDMGMNVFAGCLLPDGKGALELKKSCSDKLHIVPLDITKDDQIERAVAYVKSNLPPEAKGLYCLINNAGVLAYTDFELMTPKMCEEVININLLGTMRVTKHFLPLICKTPGRIVTITSILARLVYPGVAVYAATKHALNGFFSALRYELEEKGVHVATIEPGDFSTTTDIMQWTQRHLDEIWKNLSPEERKSKLHLFEKTKKKVNKTKCSESEQEKNYSYLLKDVEDAMLAEEPKWRYVSAPLSTRIVLWIFRSIPEKWTFKLMGEKTVRN